MSGKKRAFWVLTSLVFATLACTLITGGAEVAEDGEITVLIFFNYFVRLFRFFYLH